MSLAGSISRFRIIRLRRLGQHWTRTALSMVGVAMAVALVVAVMVTWTSVTATAEATADLAGRSDYNVRRLGGLDDAAIDAIGEVDGVDAVVPALRVPALIDDQAGYIVAMARTEVTSGFGAYLGTLDQPVTGGEVVAGREVAVTGLNGVVTQVSIDPSADDWARNRYADRLGGRFIAAPIDEAIGLAGLDAPSSVYVFGDPDRNDLLAAAGSGASVESRSETIASAQRALQPLVSSLALVALIGVTAGGMFVFNTVNSGALDTRQESALLRALGSDRRDVWWGTIGEGTVLGALGAILGVGLGLVIGALVVAAVPAAFAAVVGSAVALSIPWWLPPVGFVVGVVLAIFASLGPARAVGKMQPIEGMRSDGHVGAGVRRIDIPLLVLGLAFIAGAVAASGSVAILAAIAAALLLIRSLLGPLASTISILASLMSRPGRLAALALRDDLSRVWSMVMVLSVSAAFLITTAGVLNDFVDTSEADYISYETTDYWVSTVSGDDIAVIALPPVVVEQVEQVAGVEEVVPTRFLTASYRGRQVGVLGVGGESTYPYFALADDAARTAVLASEGVIVSRQFATAFDVDNGDTFAVPGLGGQADLPIVAVTDGITAVDGGTVVVSIELMRLIFGVDAPASLEVHLEPGWSDAGEIEQALRVAANQSDLPVRVVTGKQYFDDAFMSVRQVSSIIVMILMVVALTAGISISNTFATSILSRRQEFAMVRAMGSTRRLIQHSVLLEAAATGCIAGLIGVALGVVLHHLGTTAMSKLFHVEYHSSVMTPTIVVVLTVLVACLASLVALRRNLTGSLVEALHED